jgi:hypothetical protein
MRGVNLLIAGLLVVGALAMSCQPSNRSRSIDQWRELEAGMSRFDVRMRLGEPYRKEVNPLEPLAGSQPRLGDYEHWYYGPRITDGKLVFKNGRLSSWLEPEFARLPR